VRQKRLEMRKIKGLCDRDPAGGIAVHWYVPWGRGRTRAQRRAGWVVSGVFVIYNVFLARNMP
jgi:hypothetical protein